MLTLTTTSAELHLHVDVPVETWLLFEARFIAETPYQLANGEYLRDLGCSMRVLPWEAPHASTVYRDIGCIAFLDRYDDTMRRLPTRCLIDLSIGPTCVDTLVAEARSGRLPSRIECTLVSENELRDEAAPGPWRFDPGAGMLLIKTAAFRIPLLDRSSRVINPPR